ncbi:P-loop containing nucleoside triphosphate hydrolase protein [Leptodontidium sp. MPI-SDFR-AT-0119]|nr:P-loop containing nucleoside triphosphate hydrolase protein [Leptodontidium sp. MPI-SDFR-AT-0119]
MALSRNQELRISHSSDLCEICNHVSFLFAELALGLDQTFYETQCPDITSRLTVDAQTVQSGTAEKVGIFLQSVSYFLVAFIVGFSLNVRLTGILFAAVIPSMTLVIVTGTSVLGAFSKAASESTISAASVAEGAIKAVQVVQAFDAFESLTSDHQSGLRDAMRAGMKKAVLDSVGFSIKMGTTVGIVGASDSGKSTIAALLLRLYDPSQGNITIDSRSIKDFNLASFRHQIALVDQDPAVFSGTIYTNILDGYKGPELTIDEMRGSMTRSMGNRTTVMIAHRLASVKNADNIIVMGKGKILEQGNHELLMSYDDGVNKLTSDDSTDYSVSTKHKLALHETPESEDEIETQTSNTQELSSVEDKQLGTFAILRRCLALSRSGIFLTALALLGSLTTGALILGESIVFGHLVELLNGFVPSAQVNFYCLMFFVVALAALLGYVTSGSCFGIVSEHLVFRTRDISLRTILRQDMEWFLQPGRSPSALTSVVSMDAGHLSGLSGVIIGTIVVSALVSVVGGAILAHTILAGFARIRVLARMEEKNQHAYTEAAALASEACSNIRTIAALGTEKLTSERFYLAVDKYQKQTFRGTALGNLILAFALAVTYFVYVLAYWWGAKQVRSGQYSSLQFFIVLPAILFSAQAAGQIFSLAPDIRRAKGAASRVFALHDQKPSIDTASDNSIAPMTSITTPTNKSTVQTGSIIFKNVSLAYKSRSNAAVFANLNLTIKAGETVALVGRSGAGKTSVVSLIERFYDPTSGSVLLDGVDIKSVPVSQHRARISLVAQDPDLFAGSVAFSVGLGARPGHVATREEVIEACTAVGIHDFITGLQDGYETQCGNNGSQLSGGQKQRVAIARAHIRNPDILLLDEATSALDSHSETQIQEAIPVASRKRTTVTIAHRLTSVQRADRILVLDHERSLKRADMRS